MNYRITPIGVVTSSRSRPTDDNWDRETSTIRLDAEQFTEESLLGLDAFSHVEVLFLFDRVAEDAIETGARHPRGNTDWPRIGIFAQRGKNRPNRIGHTVARLLSVDGQEVRLSSLDAIDGTPVIDLKPWMAEFGPRGPIVQPTWSTELMRDYWSPSSDHQ